MKGPKIDPWGTPTLFLVKLLYDSINQTINRMFIQSISPSIECSAQKVVLATEAVMIRFTLLEKPHHSDESSDSVRRSKSDKGMEKN